jgi:perosamine synthetase
MSSGKRNVNGANIRWRGEPEFGGWYTDEEIGAAENAMRVCSDWRNVTPRRYREEFEQAFAQFIDVRHAISVNGAGTGLDLAMRCLNLEPGDEVISCAINFHGTHLAVLGCNARLVLCEPDPLTLNIDPADVEPRITPRTRAILVTHMNGLPADVDELLEVARRHPNSRRGPLRLIFDAARCCGAFYKGNRIGAQGWITVFSFQRKKLMSTLGEGGMIVTNDSEVAMRVRRYRGFGGGESWGSNFQMTEVQAAVGLVQLRRLDEMNTLRVRRANERSQLLEGVAGLILPVSLPDRSHLHYLYTLLVAPTLDDGIRDRIIEILAHDYGVGAVVANEPTYALNQHIRDYVGMPILPRAEAVGRRVFCPSLHPLMTEEENRFIALSIREVLETCC